MDCPNCKNKTILVDGTPECESCGAYARLNPTNATVEWMKDGRVFLNVSMEREAFEVWSNAYK